MIDPFLNIAISALENSKSGEPNIIWEEGWPAPIFMCAKDILLPFLTLNQWGKIEDHKEFCHEHFIESYCDFFFGLYSIHRELREYKANVFRIMGSPAMYDEDGGVAWKAMCNAKIIDSNFYKERTIRRRKNSPETSYLSITIHKQNEMMMIYSVGEFDKDKNLITQQNIYPFNPIALRLLIDELIEKHDRDVSAVESNELAVSEDSRRLLVLPPEDPIELHGSLDERRGQFADYLRNKLLKQYEDDVDIKIMSDEQVLEKNRLCAGCGNPLFSKEDENHALMESMTIQSAFRIMDKMTDHEHNEAEHNE